MKLHLNVPVFVSAIGFMAGISMSQDDSGKGTPDYKDWPPKPYALARYESAWSRNPFDLKTVPIPPAAAAPTDSFARNLVIAGVSQVGDEKALILVDRQTSQYHRVTATPNPEGLRLISVQHNPDIRKVVARIAKGSKEAEIRYQMAPDKPARPTAGETSNGGKVPSLRPGEENPEQKNGRK